MFVLCFRVYKVICIHYILDISPATVLFTHASRGHTVLGIVNIAAKEADREDIQFKDIT